MNVMKTCKKCNIKKSLSDFYTHRRMTDGHLNFCKSCVKIRTHNHYIKNADNIRAKNRVIGKRRRKDPAYLLTKKISCKLYRLRTKIPSYILQATYKKRPNFCEGCGKHKSNIVGYIMAHHPNYSKPTTVIWLCPICHSKEHREQKMKKERMENTCLKSKVKL